ncbi:MAG: DNA polymerase III subunit beta [Chitinophagaceae bacterium]|jgi:DNA polymerase-3 subunit beta|nr:DNA polymerase III subunit beta [Chitinophagaceae bacterium]
MKFIVSSSLLLKQLQQISGVISTNTVLPILEDFLFEINQKKLNIIATDLETVMHVQADVESSENGKICIPAKILLESLKNLPDQPLTFTIESNFGIEITSDNGKYKIMGEDPSNFPKAPSADDATGFEMSGNALLTAINKTLFAVSNDDLRPAMTGVFFELSKNFVQFISTDAHRLVRYKRTDVENSAETSFIVPKKPLTILKNALPNNDDKLSLSYNGSHLFVTYGTSSMICRLIDARFPDYKVVIPANNPYTLTVAKIDFQNALRRISVFANKSTNQVALTISGSELELAAQDVDFSFEGNERMHCQYNGENLQIAFNAKLLVELIGAIDTNDINIELSTPNKAGLVKPTEQKENEELMLLVMPLMLNSN